MPHCRVPPGLTARNLEPEAKDLNRAAPAFDLLHSWFHPANRSTLERPVLVLYKQEAVMTFQQKFLVPSLAVAALAAAGAFYLGPEVSAQDRAQNSVNPELKLEGTTELKPGRQDPDGSIQNQLPDLLDKRPYRLLGQEGLLLYTRRGQKLEARYAGPNRGYEIFLRTSQGKRLAPSGNYRLQGGGALRVKQGVVVWANDVARAWQAEAAPIGLP